MKRRREEAFLATKTHDRTRDGSLRLLEESLHLLKTDHLDLWQIHNLADDGAGGADLPARTARWRRCRRRASRRSSGSSASRATPTPTC